MLQKPVVSVSGLLRFDLYPAGLFGYPAAAAGSHSRARLNTDQATADGKSSKLNSSVIFCNYFVSFVSIHADI